jgi:glycosyltransferase involved in cell wall biosynthesis
LAPSHESAGAVVAEAMSYKIPVICFDSYGAGEIIDFSCGRKTLIDSVENSINSLSSHLKNLFYDRSLYIKLSDGAEIKFYKSLSWDEKGKKLDLIYKDLLF